MFILREPATLLALILAGIVSAGIAAALRRKLGRSGLLLTLTMWSFLAAVVGMFVAGGRPLGWRGLHVDYLSSCMQGDFMGGAVIATDTSSVINSFMFAPFAACLVLLIKRPLLGLMISGVSIVVLETAQTVLNFGVCEGADVVHNIFGAILGVVAATFVLIGRDRAQRHSSQ